MKLAILLLALAFCVGVPSTAAPQDARESDELGIAKAEQQLIVQLEGHADWCRKKRALLALEQIYQLLLEVDSNHKRARGFLGHKRKGERWSKPLQPRVRSDASAQVGREGLRRLEGARANFLSALQEQLASEYLSENELKQIEERILRLNPDDLFVHRLRGEKPFEGRWVMQDTLLARDRRAQLHSFIQDELARSESGQGAVATEFERALGLRFKVAQTSRFRVLSTEDIGEAMELSRVLPVAQALFNSVLQSESALPFGLRLFALSEEGERDVFLKHYPGLDSAYVEDLRLISGTGLRGTQDWTFWTGDRAKRKDGIVRMAFAFLLFEEFKISFEQGWLFEGLGIYLTQAVIGTRLTTFRQLGRGQLSDSALGERADLTSPETNWMREALALFHTWTASEYEDIFAKPVHEMQRGDLLASYVTLAYLSETHPDALYRIAKAAPKQISSAKLVMRELGMDLEQLIVVLRRWIEESHGEEFIPPLAAGQLWNDWGRLSKPQREQAVELFQSKLTGLQTQQMKLVRGLLERSMSLIPKRRLAEYYSPETHAPAQPIGRSWLNRRSSLVVNALETFFRPALPQAQIRIYGYDWGQGQVIQLRTELLPEEIFANAANGFAPGMDLAHSIALRELDGAEQRNMHRAFEHAYTDRDGGAYPGITLYQAWVSRAVMEMPDVDVLGLYHDISEDWSTYVAPIDGFLHAELYGIISSYFHRVRRYRELRLALADCLFIGEPLSGQFSGPRTNLHAFWAELKADTAQARAQLPAGREQQQWVLDRIARDAASPALWDAGGIRRKNLADDSNLIRHAMAQAMQEIEDR